MAQDVQRNRARRGATCSANTCRVKLQKVLMMVRVVNAFRTITDRLTAFSPKLRSRTVSPDFPASANSSTRRKNTSDHSFSPQQPQPSKFSLASVNAMGETASIAAAAAVAATTAGFGANSPTPSSAPLSCM